MNSSMKHTEPSVAEADDASAAAGGEAAAPALTPTDAAASRLTPISPAELGASPGWTHGWLAPADARLLFVAGQTAGDTEGRFRSTDFIEQFETALTKALVVVEAAGGAPEHVVRMTIYVTDIDTYLARRRELGSVWRRRMGRHYPAMALVEVTRLVEPEALVEIEVTAAVPPGAEGSRA